MATSLYSDSSPVSKAYERFQLEPGLILLRPNRRLKPYLCIPSGMYALVSRHGADLKYFDKVTGRSSYVWPAGLHMAAPWVKIIALVTQQTIVLNLPVNACKTKDNVTVDLDVSIAFRIMGNPDLGEDPELVRKFVHELKPEGLEQNLRYAQDEAVRGLARSLKHNEILGLRSGHTSGNSASSHVQDDDAGRQDKDETCVSNEHIRRDDSSDQKGVNNTENLVKKLNSQFMPQGVQILSFMIKSCALPKNMRSHAEDSTNEKMVNREQEMLRENDLQIKRMEEEIMTLTQTFDEQRAREESAGRELINEEKIKLDDDKADAAKSQAAIIEEGIARIEKLKAESVLEVQRIANRKEETISIMKLEAQREAANLHASTKLEVEQKIAIASVAAAKNRAEASRLLARAEGITAPMLHHKNVHETKLRHLQVCKTLAENENTILCDAEDDDTNMIVIADSILTEAGGNLSKSAVLAELSVLNKLSKGLFQQESHPPIVHEAVNGHQRQIMNGHHQYN